MIVSLIETHASPLTCNCLLASTARQRGAPLPSLYSACYFHRPSADEGGVSTYQGCVTHHTWEGKEGPLSTAATRGGEAVPGVFDMTWNQREEEDGESALLLCCATDGSVRLLEAQSLEERRCFSGVQEEMLTSGTPCGTSQLLCTAHTGSAVVYDMTREEVVVVLEGHDYDAWCSASTDTQDTVCTGGDDGLLKYYDLRTEAVTSKARFGAGVTSISPVLEGESTSPYQLVGSYDETLSLMDIRSPRRPVAQTAALGGGVWRCRTTLEGTVNPSGVLLLPLMQRGPAALSYHVKKEADSVFGECFYFTREEDSEERHSSLPLLTEECLVYDTAVVSVEKSEKDTTAVVASCSFYEKQISLWSLSIPN